MDIVSEKRNKLRSLFPGIFTETKNEKGETIESIGFEKFEKIWHKIQPNTLVDIVKPFIIYSLKSM